MNASEKQEASPFDAKSWIADWPDFESFAAVVGLIIFALYIRGESTSAADMQSVLQAGLMPVAFLALAWSLPSRKSTTANRWTMIVCVFQGLQLLSMVALLAFAGHKMASPGENWFSATMRIIYPGGAGWWPFLQISGGICGLFLVVRLRARLLRNKGQE